MVHLERDLADRYLRYMSWGFLFMHLLRLLLYGIYNIPPMVVLNALCLFSAAVGLRLLARERYRAHILLLYGTELLQIVISALYIGWSAGFQLPLLGLTILVFLTEYVRRSLGLPQLPALPMGLVALAVYLLLFPGRFYRQGPCAFPSDMLLLLQVFWGALVFALVVAGLCVMLQVSSTSERMLIDKAESDPLTGLYNRAGYDQLRNKLNLRHTTLLLVDADRFKEVNDNYGHEVGDRVLQKIARSLGQNFRRCDRVCRIGGDEFAVLMLNAEELEDEQIAAKVNRINRELSHTTEDRLPLVSVSVGVAYGGDAEDWTELFNHADKALYQVKEGGRRGCRFYRP